MFSSRSNLSTFSYVSGSSLLNSKETLDFLRNPIDSRSESIPEEIPEKKSTRSKMSFDFPKPKKINEEEIAEEWKKRLSKLPKPSFYVTPKPQIIQPNLMMRQSERKPDPLNRLSVEEISNSRARSQNSALHEHAYIPKARKIPYGLRANPLGRRKAYRL